MTDLVPKDHAEAIALFRSEIVGSLTRRELDRGDLSQVLTELSQQRFRPPLAKSTKTYSIATLERWYYAYKSGGIEALRPSPRSDRGRCRDLTPEQRKLLAAIREEHPSASVPVILRTLVDELVTCVNERKHAVVTGEPGVGKTCVLRALRHALGSDQSFRLTYCHNVTLGRRDFYRHICHAPNIPYGATAGDVFHSVSKHIEDLARKRTFPILLVDEAHLIHQDTLDHLHILLNYAWDSKALLSLVLIGLPDLNERLVMRRNRSLYSRLTYRLCIEPLSPNDTAEYIRARLAAAGVTKELFTSDAIAILHEAAAGSLRDIDRISHNAIRSSARRKRKLVERDVVQAILQTEAYAGSVS